RCAVRMFATDIRPDSTDSPDRHPGAAETRAGGAGLRPASTDDLDTPLHEVTFCVVDVETTGGSPVAHGITEVGAVRLRGGEQLGTFQTLVDPGVPIPPAVTTLTGITTA